MKPILKLSFIYLFVQLFAGNTFGQANAKAFVGTWELAQQTYDGRTMKAPAGYIKIFNADKTFANAQLVSQKPVTTHSGTYKVDDGFYLEKALYRIPAMISNSPLGTDFKINYQFSEDQQQLTLSFTAANGIIVVEIWKKQNPAI